MSVPHILGAALVDVAIGVILAYVVTAAVKPRRARVGWAIGAVAVLAIALMGSGAESWVAALAVAILFAALAFAKVPLPGLADTP